MTTIKLKRGTGVPSSLQYGEIAVDTGAQLLYAGTADGKVIELSGGEISWNQLVDLPDWIIEIDPNKPDSINLSELEKQVNANTEEVGKLIVDVAQIWAALQQISDLATDTAKEVEANAVRIAKNEGEINALKNEISAIESGLIFGGVYSPVTNQITQVDKYASDRGFQEGAALTTNTTAEQQGVYFIVSVSGDAVTGEAVKAGDWLIANSLSWTVVGYGFETITIDQVAGLADKLEALEEADSDLDIRVTGLEKEIDGGTYTGTPPNFRS